jgi:hypothetical protein
VGRVANYYHHHHHHHLGVSSKQASKKKKKKTQGNPTQTSSNVDGKKNPSKHPPQTPNPPMYPDVKGRKMVLGRRMLSIQVDFDFDLFCFLIFSLYLSLSLSLPFPSFPEHICTHTHTHTHTHTQSLDHPITRSLAHAQTRMSSDAGGEGHKRAGSIDSTSLKCIFRFSVFFFFPLLNIHDSPFPPLPSPPLHPRPKRKGHMLHIAIGGPLLYPSPSVNTIENVADSFSFLSAVPRSGANTTGCACGIVRQVLKQLHIVVVLWWWWNSMPGTSLFRLIVSLIVKKRKGGAVGERSEKRLRQMDSADSFEHYFVFYSLCELVHGLDRTKEKEEAKQAAKGRISQNHGTGRKGKSQREKGKGSCFVL